VEVEEGVVEEVVAELAEQVGQMLRPFL